MESIKQTLAKHNFTLRDYQENGIQWMIDLENNNEGGVLGDDPGLGKTLQVLSLIINDKPSQKTLIILPTSLLKQWVDLASMIFGKDSVGTYYGQKKHTFDFNLYKIVVTTYGTIILDNLSHGKTEFINHSLPDSKDQKEIQNYYKQQLKIWNKLSKQEKDKWNTKAKKNTPLIFQLNWNRLILDEAHRIKSSKSKAFERTYMINARYKWAITGTPMQNNKKEFLSLFKFVLQNDDLHVSNVEDLVNTYHLRRTKEKCLKDKLPDIIENQIEVPFHTDKEKDFYRLIQSNTKSKFMKIQNDDGTDKMAIMFELLLRLRQTSQHPQMVIDGFNRKYKKQIDDYTGGHSSKHLKLLQLVKEKKEPAIVFCHFTSEMNIIQNLFNSEHSIKVLRLDGSLSMEERNTIIEQSKNITDNIFIFLIQINAGGVGLNLQHISNVYITGPDWNPCNEIQAIARSHRLGQTKVVTVNRLILIDDEEHTTIDQRIHTIQHNKLVMIGDVLNDDGYHKLSKKFKLTQHKLKKLITGK